MGDFVSPLRVQLLFPLVLWGSQNHALLAFKPKCAWGSSSQCKTHELGNPMWASELTPEGEPLQYNYSPSLWVAQPRIWDLIILWVCPSYLSRGFFFVFLVVDLLWLVLIFFINDCFADSCDFGVFMRGGELRNFLFHHLSQSSNYPI